MLELTKEVRKYFSLLGKKSSSKLTPEQRKEKAIKAINTRWKKTKSKTK